MKKYIVDKCKEESKLFHWFLNGKIEQRETWEQRDGCRLKENKEVN